MKHKVVITGMGTVNPLALNVRDTWKMATSGNSGIGKITHFDAVEHTTRFAGEVKEFDPASLFGKKTARHMDRFVQFAVAATEAAVMPIQAVPRLRPLDEPPPRRLRSPR